MQEKFLFSLVGIKHALRKKKKKNPVISRLEMALWPLV